MGCDIHMIPEVKKNNYWRHAWRLDPKDDYWTRGDQYPPMDRANYFAWSDRHYRLFGILAGVRSDMKPISEPRGLPEDMDNETEIFFKDEDNDIHSASWLTLAELQAYPWDDANPYPGETWEQVRNWLTRLAGLDPDPNNVRIVFGFDN